MEFNVTRFVSIQKSHQFLKAKEDLLIIVMIFLYKLDFFYNNLSYNIYLPPNVSIYKTSNPYSP